MSEDKYTCLNCSEVFEIDDDYFIHMKQCNKKIGYNCEICGDSFMSVNALNNHIKLHPQVIDEKKESEEIKKTEEPEQVEEKKEQEIEKEKKDSIKMDEIFRCAKCDKFYDTAKKLESHKTICDLKFKCLECNTDFTVIATFATHLENCGTKTKSMCPYCNNYFVNLKSHKCKKNPNVVTEKELKFKCEICEKEYVSHKRFLTHKCGGTPFSKNCEKCNTTYKSQKAFDEHKCVKFECKICGTHYKSELIYNKHINGKLHLKKAEQ